jgi:hypothetical protein
MRIAFAARAKSCPNLAKRPAKPAQNKNKDEQAFPGTGVGESKFAIF